MMEGSTPPIVRHSSPLNREYVHAIETAYRDGVRPADPLATSLFRARVDARVWHSYWHNPLPDLRRVVERAIPGPAGPITLRMYFPRRRAGSPLAVYFHGGGFVLNGIATHERLLRDLAIRAQMPICAVGYSLAPEHRFPAQLEEATDSIRWIVRHADQLDISADRIALVGDSAGANLALATACALRDEGEIPITFLALLYGMFSTDLATPSHAAYGNGDFGLTTERVRWFWDQYVARTTDRSDPRAVPLLADLEGLPPTLLIGAGLDCLLDDTLRLADRFRRASVEHVLSVYADLPHGFATVAPAVTSADHAVSEIADALRFLTRPASYAGWAERHRRAVRVQRQLAEALSSIAGAEVFPSSSRFLDGSIESASRRLRPALTPSPAVSAPTRIDAEIKKRMDDE